MLTIKRDTAVYAMSPDNAPVARIQSRETLVFETADCFGGQIACEADRMGALDWSRINPATGPVFVEGAQPGDTLKVEILKIDLAAQAAMVEAPGEGITGLEAAAEVTKILPIQNGMAVFNDRISLPVRPMIGVIGTAPADESIATGTPSFHGGNMDCKRIGEGAALYLPVNVEGALLAMGDLHAVMGDGEVCVCGAEIAGAVTVRVSVIKGQPLPLPFLTTDKHAMAIYSAEGLDAAAQGAALRMRAFLIDQAKLPAHEAGMLLSLSGDLRICQAVDPNKTCRMELPLDVLESCGYRFP
ncbi:MAG: acetamidase/formamidase family protein [Clostridia bacterium]|nr:acetamidase/formamidase family protein [Clostridia bacterium]